MFCFVLFKTVEKRKMTIKKGRKTKPRKKIQERKRYRESSECGVVCDAEREKEKKKWWREKQRERKREKGNNEQPIAS